MAQGIQLAGGFGAGGVRDALVDLIAQRMAQQQFEEQKRARAAAEEQARAELGQRRAEMNTRAEMDSSKLALDRQQHTDNFGLNIKKFDEDKSRDVRNYTRGVQEFDTTHEFKKGEATRDQGNKDRSFGLDDLQLKESGRHNRAMEGLAGQRVDATGAKAEQVRNERAAKARATITTALATIRRLRGDDDKGNKGTGAAGFTGAVGAKGPMSAFGLLERPMGGSSAANFASEFDTLKAQLTLPELEKMRGQGALSDRDVAMLSSGATSLSRAQDEGAFLAELNRLYNGLSATLGTMDGGNASSGPKIGDVVNIGGKRVRISTLYPDGTFDGEDVP